jgi:hypothetical protein
MSPSYDETLLAILEAPLRQGEPAFVGFQRKEVELRDAFARLPLLEARELHARLAKCRPDDALAARFAHLVADRRSRLLAFLADARRRAARAMAV